MSRIPARFAQLRSRGRKALIPFVTAGDPAPSATVPLMHAMVGAGADIIELGVPFSDPMADGPVIQRASERALEKGVTLAQTLTMVREFRARDDATPVVLMGYLLEKEGIDVEVLDLRTTSPLDREAILKSLEKTGKMLIVQEAWPNCSVSSEVAATVAIDGIELLDSPVRRITAKEAPIPFSPVLEDYVLPQTEDIIKTVKEMVD